MSTDTPNGRGQARALSRRALLARTATVAAASAWPSLATLTAEPAFTEHLEVRRLVAANRILAHESVVDGFGHVSVRHPLHAARYVMSRSRSPELVEAGDLMEFEQDGTPLDARGRTPYGERMIHGAIYAARSDVNAVIHNHSYAVLPFTITDVPLEPMIHMAAVIGPAVPVWDIREDFGATDMLVRTMDQGRSLARALGANSCVLMRGHGAVVAARDVKEAVMIAFYLQVNAEIERAALDLGKPRPLAPEEIELAAATQFSPLALDRVWEYFCARAGVEPI